MRRADLVIGAVLLLVAGFYFQQTFTITRGFASDRLGPTFFPRLLALALAACAIGLIARSVGGRSDPVPPPAIPRGLLVGVLAVTVAYGIALPWLGFVLATPLLLGVVIWLLGLREWKALLGTSVGVTAVLYLAFVRGLHVLLPMGPLGGR